MQIRSMTVGLMPRPCRFLMMRFTSAFRDALRMVDVAAVDIDEQERRGNYLEHLVLAQYNCGGVDLHQIVVGLQSEQ